MKRIFLEKYFPASRAANIRKGIYDIKQYTGESLHEYWERSMLDAASGGVFVDKTPQAARNLIENMAFNSQQFDTNRSDSTPRRNNEVNVSSLEQQMIDLKSLVRQLAVGNGQNVKKCGICAAMGHSTEMCPTLQEGSTEQETRASIQHLNTQVGQLATTINRLEAQNSNSLPSQTMLNPKKNGSAITLRSGRELKVHEEVMQEQVQNEDVKESKVEENELNHEDTPRGSEYKPVAPFPLALKESRKDEGIKGLYETFRRCEVNIPLLDVIKQVPRYAKFLKELCTAKRQHKLKGCKKVELGEQVSAVIRRKTPEKWKDPDVNNGTLTMKFDGEIVKFNIFDNLNFSSCESAVNNLDINDYLSQEHKKVVNEGKLKDVMARPVKISLFDLQTPKAEEPRISRNSKKRPKLTVKVLKWVKNRVPPPLQSEFQYDTSVIPLDMEEDDTANT
ncbi:uncharacterized protein [Henckelia pumila]|uniref:uncharacterized protein n=1 Tax=Henckelia pumila TaxID=405737 RepID=UPI003C6DEA19